MKKVLLALLLLITLVGCGKKEVKYTDYGWALHYAVEYHETNIERLPKEYAFKIEEVFTVGLDGDSCAKLSCQTLYFEVTLITEFDIYVYHVIFEKADTIWKFYSEKTIIQYDVEPRGI